MPKNDAVHYKLTEHGFEWGPLRVSRVFHDDRVGFVLCIETEAEEMRVRVSPKGRKLSASKPGEVTYSLASEEVPK